MTRPFTFAAIGITLAGGVLLACSDSGRQPANTSLLAIPVASSQSIAVEDWNQKLARTIAARPQSDHPQVFLPELIGLRKAQHSLLAIETLPNQDPPRYNAVMIIDDIAADDSISGYRYDLTLGKDAQGHWQILSVNQSWRCWPDRGHRDFSVRPCQ